MNTRNTHQKELILDVISGINVHMTMDEILEKIHTQDPSIGQATVYRNLNRFVQEGKIQKICGDGYSYYDGNAVPHDHLHCVRCGKITDFPSITADTLDEQMQAATGVRILSHSITYEGICSDCAQQS